MLSRWCYARNGDVDNPLTTLAHASFLMIGLKKDRLFSNGHAGLYMLLPPGWFVLTGGTGGYQA